MGMQSVTLLFENSSECIKMEVSLSENKLVVRSVGFGERESPGFKFQVGPFLVEGT